MKAWTIDALGRDRLRMTELQKPEPRAGEVLVRVANVSLNYRDLLVLEGKMGDGRAFPFVPGSDLARTVTACGAGVSRFAVGDRVMTTYVPGWIDGRQLGSAGCCYRCNQRQWRRPHPRNRWRAQPCQFCEGRGGWRADLSDRYYRGT